MTGRGRGDLGGANRPSQSSCGTVSAPNCVCSSSSSSLLRLSAWPVDMGPKNACFSYGSGRFGLGPAEGSCTKHNSQFRQRLEYTTNPCEPTSVHHCAYMLCRHSLSYYLSVDLQALRRLRVCANCACAVGAAFVRVRWTSLKGLERLESNPLIHFLERLPDFWVAQNLSSFKWVCGRMEQRFH
jgi:hypothetical protein